MTPRRPANGGWAEVAAMALCVTAAVAASYLSGVNFPEQNNVWHLPIVLDFYRSAEGPHDAYNASFVHFTSLFWVALRPFTTAENVQKLFVALQISGNAGLALALYGLIRLRVASAKHAALVTAFFCFCYGLWGPTRLGYSEVFVTYATHTQFAIIFCLICLTRLASGRVVWAAIFLGLAASINLFIAAWGGLASGMFLVWTERRLASRKQFQFVTVFALLAAPVLIWALLGGDTSGAVIPTSFFHAFLGGHVYGLGYPQALVQTFALLLGAGFAMLALERGKSSPPTLGMVTVSATVALAVGAVMPYVTDRPLLLLLHPLRFNSVTMVLAAACAGALLAAIVSRASNADPVAGFIAAAGFLLKMPVVSVFGFALLLRGGSRKLAAAGLTLTLIETLAVLLPTPVSEVPLKAAVAYGLMCCVLLLAVTLQASRDRQSVDTVAVQTATVLGALGALPMSASVVAATLVSLLSVAACFTSRNASWRVLAYAANTLSAAVLLHSASQEPRRQALILAGLALGAILPPLAARFAPRSAISRRVSLPEGALAAIVLALITLGIGKGATAGFGITSTQSQLDFAETQGWARSHLAIDAMVMAFDVPNGFSLFARRPVWWESSQGAAVLWMPSFHALYDCRARAVEAARVPAQRVALATAAGVDYILVNAEAAEPMETPEIVEAYRNRRFVILRNDSPRPATPLCPDQTTSAKRTP